MTSINPKVVIHWCRLHWNWLISGGLHLIVIILLLMGISDTNKQYSVTAQATQNQPHVVNAQMVSASQVMPEKPKVKVSPPKIHKPKPKVKKVAVKKIIPQPKAKPKPRPRVTKPTIKKPMQKKNIDHKALQSLRNMALNGISDAAQQQQAQAQALRHWQTEKEKYLGIIQQLIRVNWNNPDPGADLHVILLIQLNDKGDVQSVSVGQSSGNDAFDRQAVLAVQKSSPLPLPKDQLLAQQFMSLRLPFGGSL